MYTRLICWSTLLSCLVQADLAPMQDGEDVKRPREENGHTNGHILVCTL